MILITSAAYITSGLVSEFGKLPPCMLPVQNMRLYEHQLSIIPKGELIIISLPKSYEVMAYDAKRLSILGVKVVSVPDELSLGQSIVYVLNVVGRYNESIGILHGDTLFSELPFAKDVCAIAKAEDNYEWASASIHDKNIYAGYFSFSNQSLLIQKITESGYEFICGVKEYANQKSIVLQQLPNWMDFGLVNSYYRSISKMTTQRVFNSIKVTRSSICKSSSDKKKIAAESNWITALPKSMKHYAPAVFNKGEDKNKGFYEIEYYFLPSLSNLFVFGKNKPYIWEEIINACIEYLNDELQFKPLHPQEIAVQNNKLYSAKTLERLHNYKVQANISLDVPWIFNGIKIPSLNNIIAEIEPMISKDDIRFATLMHGDLCFSNILYDFKSKSIKVIDPRGVDFEGNISIYGDFRYDVGKLGHSVLGMYDFIISEMYEYSENSQYDIKLNFETRDDIVQIQEYFTNQKFGGYSLTELNTFPILIHLFLSMLPLHNDNTQRQKAMLANALRLYIELKK